MVGSPGSDKNAGRQMCSEKDLAAVVGVLQIADRSLLPGTAHFSFRQSRWGPFFPDDVETGIHVATPQRHLTCRPLSRRISEPASGRSSGSSRLASWSCAGNFRQGVEEIDLTKHAGRAPLRISAAAKLLRGCTPLRNVGILGLVVRRTGRKKDC